MYTQRDRVEYEQGELITDTGAVSPEALNTAKSEGSSDGMEDDSLPGRYKVNPTAEDYENNLRYPKFDANGFKQIW